MAESRPRQPATHVPDWSDGPPDPLAYPGPYRGVVGRRVLAFLVDQVLITVLVVIGWMALAALQILTLGLVTPLPAVGLVVLIGFGYHTYFLGGRGATLGMAWMDIEIRDTGGAGIDYIQALLRTVLFYVTIIATAWLILVIGLLNPRRRCAHDLLSNTVVVRCGHRPGP